MNLRLFCVLPFVCLISLQLPAQSSYIRCWGYELLDELHTMMPASVLRENQIHTVVLVGSAQALPKESRHPSIQIGKDSVIYLTTFEGAVGFDKMGREALRLTAQFWGYQPQKRVQLVGWQKKVPTKYKVGLGLSKNNPYYTEYYSYDGKKRTQKNYRGFLSDEGKGAYPCDSKTFDYAPPSPFACNYSTNKDEATKIGLGETAIFTSEVQSSNGSNSTLDTFDHQGRLISTYHRSKHSYTYVKYNYDSLGLVIEKKSGFAQTPDFWQGIDFGSHHKTICYSYNSKGQPTKAQCYLWLDSTPQYLESETSYSYSSDGLLQQSHVKNYTENVEFVYSYIYNPNRAEMRKNCLPLPENFNYGSDPRYINDFR